MGECFVADDSVNPSAIRRLVDTAWSANAASADPDDASVRGFAEFGLSPDSPLATDGQLHQLEAWRDDLNILPNSAFLDGTLLHTVEVLLGSDYPDLLTPVTLWELTTFIDALVCFDRLYCLANTHIDISRFNQKLGAQVLMAIPDPDGGVLRRVAGHAAADGVSNMRFLSTSAGHDDAWGQEVQAVVDGWRAVLGPDFPSNGPFDISGIDTRLAEMAAVSASPEWLYRRSNRSSEELAPFPDSAEFVDGDLLSVATFGVSEALRMLIDATSVPVPPEPPNRPPLADRQQFAASTTYRTYVNQGIANALALPYLPGTLRMPFRRLFVRRASEVQDELVSVALADRIFAQQQPSSPLILPFFTTAVLQRATSHRDIWAQLARMRDQSAAFRRVRADLDRLLERSQVSAEALRFQNAIRDEALKLADLAGATQQSASVALGVVAQTGIVPLAGALKVGVDAARGAGRGGSWARIWRRLFHRHEYFLAQTNTQAMALTNALPQLERLWNMPTIGAYLKRFADATQQIGHMLRD
jgi:hypothetical protein